MLGILAHLPLIGTRCAGKEGEDVNHTGMSLVNIVPNQVLTWIGGTFGSNVGTDIGHGVQNKAEGFAGSTGGVSGQVGQKGFADSMGGVGYAAKNAPVRTVSGAPGRYSKTEVDAAKGAVRRDNLMSAMRPQQAGARSGAETSGGAQPQRGGRVERGDRNDKV